MPVSDMPDITSFSPNDVDLPTYGEPVNIFLNTRAIDVPAKLNLLAGAFRDFNISVKEILDSHTSDESNRMGAHLSASVQSMVDFVNNSVVQNQNDFITTANGAIDDIEEERLEFVEGVVAATDTFKQDIMDELEGQATNMSYSMLQSNDFAFSGETTNDTYDERGRVLSCTQGVKTCTNIVYDTRCRVVSYTEIILVGSISYTKDYTVSYERGKVPKIEEI